MLGRYHSVGAERTLSNGLVRSSVTSEAVKHPSTGSPDPHHAVQ
jgi:hypothetical protein